MNIVYLISQIVGFIAFVISLVAYHRKKKEKIFKTMMLANLLDITHYLLLGAYSGCITKVIALVRNEIIILKEKHKKFNKILVLIILLATTLSLMFNNLGVIGLFPVISTITYILLMNTKDIIKFKWLIVFTMLMWLIYDLFIKSYTSAFFDFMNIVANIISIIQIRLQNKKMGC